MRKLMVLALGVAAVLVACENKTPVGPGTVTVTQTTSSVATTSIPPPVTTTTTTTSTTTTVPGSLSRRYVAFPVVPNAPADMTLFFELLTANGTVATLLDMIPLFGPGITENEYKVTGVYVMGNGTTGDVNGELGEALNPLETGGTFEGTMTAKMPSCTAERVFTGALSGQNIQWDGGRTIRDCAGSPLAMSSFRMVRGDVPLPTTTVPPASTTTSSSTTSSSSTSTTTSTITCNYSLSPTSASVPAAGGQWEVVIGTLPGCAWAAQSFAPAWLSVAPASGTGPAAVTYRALPNTGAERTGTLVVAGQTFTVTQAAAPDLLPIDVPEIEVRAINGINGQTEIGYCSTDCTTCPTYFFIDVVNSGLAAAPASVTRASYPRPGATPATEDQPTDGLAVGQRDSLRFVVNDGCFTLNTSIKMDECVFTITADGPGAIFESNESNNTVTTSCARPVRVSRPAEAPGAGH